MGSAQDFIEINVIRFKLYESGIREFRSSSNANMSVDDLAKMKDDTIKFDEDCKEFEQVYDNFNKQVKQVAVAIDKELNPDIKDCKVK